MKVQMYVNGDRAVAEVQERTSLADLLRGPLGLTGTHLGCEQGACGACTVLLDDDPVRSCLLFAVQAGGSSVVTVEGLADSAEHPAGRALQKAFLDHHALQCGFCTPGFLVTATALIGEGRALTRSEVALELSGNICRCTGYQPIIDAVAEVLAQRDLLVEERE